MRQPDNPRAWLWSMPFADRAAALIISFIEQDGDPVRFITRVLALISYLSDGLSAANRGQLACCLRDLANHVEADDDNSDAVEEHHVLN